MSLLERTGGARLARGQVEMVPAAAPAPEEAAGPRRRGMPAPAMGRVTLYRRFDEIRRRLRPKLIAAIEEDPHAERELEQLILELLSEVVDEMHIALARFERRAIVEELISDIAGLGPLEPLIADPEVTDILVNAHDRIYAERAGGITREPITFEDDAHLMRIVGRMLSAVGRRVDEATPMVDARLRDGSRVNVIIAPLALSGPTMTIRKFAKDPLQVSDLLTFGTCTQGMVDFLSAAVRSRLNIAVCGGGASGKTTTLNILSGFIPEDERIVTIEDTAELQLRQPHVVPLEARPANVEGRGAVTIRDLVINTLRMRPDRIVVGECRSGETLDMLQAMNTGHDGSLTTLHANSPVDAISRLETMVLMAGTDLPSRAIREQIASAIQLFVHQVRLHDGSRKIVRVTECTGFDGEHVRLKDIFVFRQTGLSDTGEVLGDHVATGVVPECLDTLVTTGHAVDARIFTRPLAVV